MAEPCDTLTAEKTQLSLALEAFDVQIAAQQGVIDGKWLLTQLVEQANPGPAATPLTVATIDARLTGLAAIAAKYTDLKTAVQAKDTITANRLQAQLVLNTIITQWTAAGCGQQ